MFLTLEDALNWIDNQKRFNRRVDLSQMEEALKRLNNPEKDMKFVHIGGTNGKGSTATYTYRILRELGLNVGLYTSPYVVSFNERIRFNEDYISDDDALRLINFLYDFNNDFMKTHETLTFFELVTLMAFLYFREKKCDIAVFEVGLGGRLDATNVITPLVSAITNIEKDHTQILGKTYKLIAKEKLGIVKDGVPFVSTEAKETLMKEFQDRCSLMKSEFIKVRGIKYVSISPSGTDFYYSKIRWHTPLIGLDQAKNAALAIEIAKTLKRYDDYPITVSMIEEAFKKTKWPGRFEPFFAGRLILDGGHNPGALASTFKTMKAYSPLKVKEVFACMKDKDFTTMVKMIDNFASSVIFTGISYPRAQKAEILNELSHLSDKMAIDDPIQAVRTALKELKNDEILLVNGSLYFVSLIRTLLMEGKICLN